MWLVASSGGGRSEDGMHRDGGSRHLIGVVRALNRNTTGD
jgi:hypothetical protein